MSAAPDIRIRYATAADVDDVERLIREMARALGDRFEMGDGYPAVFLAHPDTGIVLAELGGRAVGLLAYSIRPNLFHGGPAGVIEEFVVEADVRRRGIGTALLDHILSLFEEKECVEVSLNTDLDNVRAQAVYRRVGLTEESLQLAMHARPRTGRPRPLS